MTRTTHHPDSQERDKRQYEDEAVVELAPSVVAASKHYV